MYVNDFEEAALLLSNPEKTEVVGRSQFGAGKICAIPGQSPSAYFAVDVGSERPAFAVFRSITHPPPKPRDQFLVLCHGRRSAATTRTISVSLALGSWVTIATC